MKKISDDDRIIRSFERLINVFGELGKIPRDFGVASLLYPSEIHMLVMIGENPGIKVTELAKKLGVTKGAIPKMTRKLERKGLIINYKSPENKKEVLFKLSDEGRTACEGHSLYHAEVDKGIKRKLKMLSQAHKNFLYVVFQELEEYADEMMKKEQNPGKQ
jgi:DNA-binding MarR family transcriptional regulator